MLGLWHHDIAIVESVTYTTSDTFSSNDLFTINANSVMSMIADSSLRGMVEFISLDFAVNIAQDQSPFINFLPA